MTNQHFAVLDLGTGFQTKGQPHMAGILGLEIFERMAVTVDEPGGTLTIEPFVPGRPCEGDRVPLLFDDDQPSVAGKIDGIPALSGSTSATAAFRSCCGDGPKRTVADAISQRREGSGSGVGGSNVTYRTSHHDIVIGHTLLRDTDAFTRPLRRAISRRGQLRERGPRAAPEICGPVRLRERHMCMIAPRE